jgi:tetratricopeptide (TPR) repeat protein
MRDGLVASVQEAVRGDKGVRLIYVTGVSGVGKTTIISRALEAEGFGASKESFFFTSTPATHDNQGNDKEKGKGTPHRGTSQFKDYLNNLLLVRQPRLPLLSRLFSSEVHVEDIHLSVHAPLSFAVTLRNRDWMPKPKTARRSKFMDINFSHGLWRLNGSIEIDFFTRLWNTLRLSGCRHLHIGNIEYATAKEQEYIFMLAQVTPEDCCLILEFGSLVSDGHEDSFRRSLETYAASTATKRIVVEPFDEPTALTFYRRMSVRRKLPPFNHGRSQGIPICILNEIRIVDARYAVGGHLKEWLSDPDRRTELLVLALLATVTDDRDVIECVLKNIVPSSELLPYTEAGILDVGLEFISYAHASYVAYIETNLRPELDLLFPRVLGVLFEVDRISAYVLWLGRGGRLDISSDVSIANLAQDMLVLLDDLRFSEIRHLFNVGVLDIVTDDAPESGLLYVFEAMVRIHDLDSKSFRLNRLANVPWPVGDLVQIYADYQFERRESALSRSKLVLQELKQRLPIAEGRERDALVRVAAVLHLMMGSAMVGSGRYKEARHQFSEADGLGLSNNSAAYLRVLDGFIVGMSYQADLSPHDPPRGTHPYIAAKIAHNILACRIELGRLEDCEYDLFETSIRPLEVLGSRELTYGLNNLAVVNLLRGRYDEAIELLRSLGDRAYQLYDLSACCNNGLCHAILTGDYDSGLEFREQLEAIFEKRGFADPTFRMMSYSNIAAFAWRFGDVVSMEHAIAAVQLNPAHEAASYYTAKIRFMQAAEFSGELTIDEDRPLIEERFVFYPVVLHHWDFYIPPIDSVLLRDWVTAPADNLRCLSS